jgi:DNA-binding CsgD family transcriptional regulator
MNETGRNPLQQLSSREREVLALVISGRKSKEIAVRFGISPATVDTYRSRIAVKLGIKDLPGLVRFAIDHGIAGL